MALIGQGFRNNSSPARYSDISATVALGGGAATIASMNFDGKRRNIFAGEASINKKSSVPSGTRHPVAWIMGMQAGGMASRNETSIASTMSGLAVLGFPAQGTTTVTIDTSATGGLIVSGIGVANISLAATGAILSVADGQGQATITLTPAAQIGAEAGIAGSAGITASPTATMTAIGYMAGLSTSETEFSAAALASAVWKANAGDYNSAGTMGEKLNDAGSAANPWTEVIESGYTAADILRILAAVAAGNATGLDGSDIIFRDINDTKDRITATISGGTRTATDIDAT